MAKFRHPMNGYERRGGTSISWLWALLFGPLFFAFKGIWRHAIVNLLTFWMIVPYIAYAVFASRILDNKYRQEGWIEVGAQRQAPQGGIARTA